MKFYCTYFDRNFLYQGLTLYESLRENVSDFTLWVLCFDETTFDLLNNLNLPCLKTIHLEEFETAHPHLVDIKVIRSNIEYYWTATPMLPLYIFNLHPLVDKIAYLDADLFFYDDLQPIYDEWGDGSIYLIPHRFAPEHQKNGELQGGLYNVGFVGFRRDKSGLAALDRWVQLNLEWCYDRIESGRLGDQKYLHDWAERFSNVIVSQNHGIGAGGWNILRYRISQKDGLIYLDEYPLVMLHLNFVSMLSPKCFYGISRWNLRPIYRPYAQSLYISIKRLQQIAPDFHPNYSRIPYLLFLKKLVFGGIVYI